MNTVQMIGSLAVAFLLALEGSRLLPQCEAFSLPQLQHLTRATPLHAVLHPLEAQLDSADAFARRYKQDFPCLLQQVVEGVDLVYLDSAASSQKPCYVLDAMDRYYRTSHSNVHRGAHALAARATDMYESARDKVQKFIGAEYREEIVFTRGATDSINTIAQAYTTILKPGDEIVLTVMEHHSNLVPWQMLAARTGAVIKYAQLYQESSLDFDHFKSLLSPKTKIVSCVHVSNALGCKNPVEDMFALAHATTPAVCVLDACQSVPHMSIDVQSLDCDYLAASSHKMCGPTGVGILYGKRHLLNELPPAQGGGEMIDEVFLTHSTWAQAPSRFEAGTPPIAEAVGLGAACEYLTAIGMDNIEIHERVLGSYLYEQLSTIEGLRLYGPKAPHRASLVAFNSDAVHASDLAFFLDQEGVCVRAGHHCTQPLHRILGAKGSLRASLYLYNDKKDVDTLIQKLQGTLEMFGSLKSQI